MFKGRGFRTMRRLLFQEPDLSSPPLTSPLAQHPARRSDTRTLGPWIVAEFLISYSSTLILTGCYDWAEHGLHASPSERLFIMALWGLAYIFIAILGGRISEKWGPRRAASSLCGLSILTCLGGLLAIRFPVLWMVPLVMLPFNVTCTMIWPAIESGLTRSPGRMPLSARMSMYNIAWGSAGFLATFTHGWLESLSFRLIFIVPAAACTLAAITLHVWAIPAHMIGGHNPADDVAGEKELDDPAVRCRAKLLLKMAWITNPLAYVAIYVLIPVMTELAKQAGVTDLGLAGVVGSVWFVVRFGTFAVAGRWTGWHYKVGWQIGPLLALAGSFAGMLVFHNLAALIGLQVVFGFSAAILYSASLYYSMHVSSGHGGHAAFHEAAIGAGTLAGPLVGALAATGKMDQPAMLRIAISVSGILFLGLLAIVYLGRGRPARASEAEGAGQAAQKHAKA